MAKGLTDKQRSIFEFIIDYQRLNGFPPTIRELGDAFRIGSLRGVTVHLDALVRKGHIARGRASRAIRITAPDPRGPACGSDAEPATRLPLARKLSDGSCRPLASDIERYLAVPEDLAAPATPVGYLVRIGDGGVPGEAMLAGDLVVVQPVDHAGEAELVAVRSDKGIAVRRATTTDTEIAGRVVGLIRCY